MRIIIIVLLFTSWWNSIGQTNTCSAEIPDCELLTTISVNKLKDGFINNQADSFDVVVNAWIRQCGISECTQRIIILKNIKDKKPSSESIRLYFENNFHYIFRNRIEDSRKINYGYIYSDNKAYYGFVPLRHKIDSVIIAESMELLKSHELDPDEKLICILFSGDTELFDKEIDKKEYNSGFIKQHLRKNLRDNHNRWLGYTIYSGFFKPIGSSGIFSYSPIFGATFSTPLSNKLIVELGIKFRFNINDRSFQYYALGDTNLVNSDVSIFFGGLVGYKIYESPKWIVIPKAGAGLESVSTGLSEKKKNSQEKTYHDIETIHFSLGLSAMTPVWRKSYIGFGINYHYCPYQSDKNLLTKFDHHLISTEVFWRF